MKKIFDKFNERKPKMIGRYRKSSVMILLINLDGELNIVFEKRALTLNSQPGDISLPGGAIEEGESPKAAAIREAMEELNIDKKSIKQVGTMDYFISAYNSIIYSFVGELTQKIRQPNLDEVDHIFYVPLKFFMDNEPKEYWMELVPEFRYDFPFDLIHGGKNYNFSKRKQIQYFYRYNDYVIWGFTALIIKRFIEIIKME
ncbi:CoA pyrophosphatase [Clostridium sediminicola]|uniref:NUDIX hydrolase n=1 Tax=Clostridium sediminicola TaxID=3114879 RepID=UPI0031F1C5C6